MAGVGLGSSAVLVLGVVAIAASCGGTPPEHSGSDGAARLRVTQKVALGSLYTEGSYSYVRVEQGGDEVSTVKLEDAPAELRLDPGSYRLSSFQRPCDGTCSNLDPPTDQCELPLELAKDQVVTATVRLTPGKGCTIELSAYAGRTNRPAAAFSAIVCSPPFSRTVSCSAGATSRTSTLAPGTKPWS